MYFLYSGEIVDSHSRTKTIPNRFFFHFHIISCHSFIYLISFRVMISFYTVWFFVVCIFHCHFMIVQIYLFYYIFSLSLCFLHHRHNLMLYRCASQLRSNTNSLCVSTNFGTSKARTHKYKTKNNNHPTNKVSKNYEDTGKPGSMIADKIKIKQSVNRFVKLMPYCAIFAFIIHKLRW